MAPPRILILGHSFIRPLAGRFLQKRGHEHLMAKLSSLGSISFHGVGELETLVRYLHDEFNVKSIAVCQVIRRHSPECTAYNFKVAKLHLYLKAVLEPIPYCIHTGDTGVSGTRGKTFTCRMEYI